MSDARFVLNVYYWGEDTPIKAIIFLGTVPILFKKRDTACKWYIEKFPHMRELDVSDTDVSDWCPHTLLKYELVECKNDFQIHMATIRFIHEIEIGKTISIKNI